MSDLPIKTPCVAVCFVDAVDQICVGCFRNMDELAQWTKYTDAERETIMADLPRREEVYKAKRVTKD